MATAWATDLRLEHVHINHTALLALRIPQLKVGWDALGCHPRCYQTEVVNQATCLPTRTAHSSPASSINDGRLSFTSACPTR
jgi:hypothetical protein